MTDQSLRNDYSTLEHAGAGSPIHLGRKKRGKQFQLETGVSTQHKNISGSLAHVAA